MVIDESFNKFSIPNDLFFEDDNGYICFNYVQVSCKNNDSVSISDLNIPLSIFNNLFREFTIFIFMHNNNNLFTDEEWNQIINYSSIRKDKFNEINAIPYKNMSNPDFIDFSSAFISSVLNCYMQLNEEELMDAFIRLEIYSDSFRHENGLKLLYNYYMRLFVNLIYNKSDKKDIKIFYNDLLPINDISGYDIINTTEFKNKYNFKINLSGEDNDIYRITIYKLFLNMVSTFHNALKEIVEPLSNRSNNYNRLANCPCLLNIIDKTGFSSKDPIEIRMEKAIKLLTNYNKNRKNKAIFSIVKQSIPFLINTNIPYYSEKTNVS